MVRRWRAMPKSMKFDVFGRIMVAERSAAGWRLFVAGADGKLARAEIVVPDFVHEHELEQYLDDMFHEMATRERPRVTRLPT
jgi:hypothetical protein